MDRLPENERKGEGCMNSEALGQYFQDKIVILKLTNCPGLAYVAKLLTL